jgi:long-chain acyl-CoA synthetase
MCLQLGVLGRNDPEITYLYLPLAHSYALLIQLLTVDVGGTIAYFGGDTKQIVAELVQVRPTYLPSVPRVFEKIYTLVTSSMDPETLAKAVQVGMQVQDLKVAGQPVPRRCRPPTTSSTPSSSSTCGAPSAAASCRPTRAPRRSPARSSSSSGPAACR